jgi:glutathione synthase/RimK-type ligase-like ATP-grasp enzyme
MLAAKAYDLYNAEIAHTGLAIHTPETIWDVAKPEVPLWVQRMGGLAVVKVPYANAGQGVWTITNPGELKQFMDIEHRYDRFIVQVYPLSLSLSLSLSVCFMQE